MKEFLENIGKSHLLLGNWMLLVLKGFKLMEMNKQQRRCYSRKGLFGTGAMKKNLVGKVI